MAESSFNSVLFTFATALCVIRININIFILFFTGCKCKFYARAASVMPCQRVILFAVEWPRLAVFSLKSFQSKCSRLLLHSLFSFTQEKLRIQHTQSANGCRVFILQGAELYGSFIERRISIWLCGQPSHGGTSNLRCPAGMAKAKSSAENIFWLA